MCDREMTTIGTCASCVCRDDDGYCMSGKLEEIVQNALSPDDDMLVYDYNEGGGFKVGDNFGCIHWAEKSQS